jgi:cell division septation protein DedD
MPKNEDGEFELILGNRQLLSVFFIVVVLLGVFFTMGYIVGRNSSPALLADSGRKTETRPIVVDRPAPSGGSPTAGGSESAAESPTPEASTTPAAPPPRQAAQPAPEPKRPPERAETKPESASPTPDVPAAGSTYLQVAAVAKTEAELFVDVMAKKGFHALYTTAPIPNTYRVLVGPFQDSSAVAQARADLNKAGFKGFEAIVRKY